MHLIIISPPEDVPGETQIVDSIFARLPVIYHLRKPGKVDEQLADYLNRIAATCHFRVMVHGYKKLLRRFNLKGIHYSEKVRCQQPQAIRQFRRAHPDSRISSAFHHITDVPDSHGLFDYIFLRPIFDSISKKGYHAAFDHADLRRCLSRTGHTVIALGGIDEQRVAMAARLGFKGVAVLGSVWESADPEKAAGRLWSRCRVP